MKFVKGTILLATILLNTLCAQFSLTISTDKEVYEYGEAITIYSRLQNMSDSTIEVWFSCYKSMQAEFFLDDFSSYYHTAGLATMEPVTFSPGSERVYKWVIDPKRYGFPNFSGEHKITGMHTKFPDLLDSCFINAPKYYGGYLNLSYNNSFTTSVDSFIQTNNYPVLEYSIYNTSSYKKIDIAGHSLDSTLSALESTSFFTQVYPDHQTDYESVYLTSVEEDKLVDAYKIFDPYPNPSNPQTTIKYVLPFQSDVDFYIYNTNGELIEHIQIGEQHTGSYEIKWNGVNSDGQKVASGIYLYRFIIRPKEEKRNPIIKAGKIILMK